MVKILCKCEISGFNFSKMWNYLVAIIFFENVKLIDLKIGFSMSPKKVTTETNLYKFLTCVRHINFFLKDIFKSFMFLPLQFIQSLRHSYSLRSRKTLSKLYLIFVYFHGKFIFFFLFINIELYHHPYLIKSFIFLFNIWILLRF